jgi:hypothetical protein
MRTISAFNSLLPREKDIYVVFRHYVAGKLQLFSLLGMAIRDAGKLGGAMNINLSSANVQAYLDILHKGKTSWDKAGESGEKFVSMMAAAIEGKEEEEGGVADTASDPAEAKEASSGDVSSTDAGTGSKAADGPAAIAQIAEDIWRGLENEVAEARFHELFAGFREDELRRCGL